MAPLKTIKAVAEGFEGLVLSPFILSLARSAEKIVAKLQEEGPNWSGEFSNSWQIESPSKVSTGSKQTGAPTKLKAPILTPKEFKFKPEIKYTIRNISPYAAYALDLKEGRFYPRTPKLSNKTIQTGSRPNAPHKRGAVTPGDGTASSSAELDWYTTYVNSGNLDRAIQVELDKNLRNLKV